MAEVEAFIKSIEGAFARADRLAAPEPGRTTMRRLNRAEHNDSIGELLAIDFTPADGFASDDVGHGFDNFTWNVAGCRGRGRGAGRTPG